MVLKEGSSCLSALLEVYDNILAYQLEGSTNVDMIYLDIRQGVLCLKLRHLAISDELGVWFIIFKMTYLNLSEFQVVAALFD